MKTTKHNPPPRRVLELVASYLARGADLQQTRRHVVRHHGRAEWQWLSTTPHESHGRERGSVARWLRDVRKLAAQNGYAPCDVFRLARELTR